MLAIGHVNRYNVQVAAEVRFYDVVVAGAGPGGSVAAFELARNGARVALVDKAHFPRDKACGDLVGPRGVGLLGDLGIVPEGTVSLGDMEVIGPSGGRILLPAVPGLTYPGCAWALPRKAFDLVVYEAAMKAGAEAITARVAAVEVDGDGGGVVMELDNGHRLRAGSLIGADGATSTVAGAVGMVRADRVQWGFAVRTYLEVEVELPVIVLFDEEPGVGFPGYGWIFPGADGMANAGVGVGTGSDRRAGARATRYLDTFLGHLQGLGLLPEGAVAGPRLGGWLKMGMLGTSPVSGPVLLVGDAAGLVNPLQGEGIAQAMLSGQAAASAVLGAGSSGGAGAEAAGATYGRWLRQHQSSYQGSTATLQGLLLTSPRMVSRVGRMLTWPPVGRRLAPGWALYWNDLTSGAAPGRGRTLARMASGAIRGLSAASPTRRELDRNLVGPR
ncbi:MAG TPA: geranylgeranyl reductase family protein [Acidimicrobiales bacterium]|nr:geranylgeranyl reductase family protein [Acidimicrobiales bacterium]